ncbi:MAG: universal stress protein [Pseudomonadota bacterium]
MKKRILAAVDGSEQSLDAIRHAGGVLFPGSTELILCHIMPRKPPVYSDNTDVSLQQAYSAWFHKVRQAADCAMSAARSAADAAGFLAKDVRLKCQPAMAGVARDILEEAYKADCDAVLMGRRGLGAIDHFLMGSVSNRLVEQSRLPLWLVEGRHLPPGVLVGINNSEEALAAVDVLGFMLEDRPEIPVTLLYVQPPALLAGQPDPSICAGSEAEKDFPFLAKAKEELMKAGLAEGNIRVSACRRGRDPARELLREAHEGGHGTVVTGRRGLRGMKAFLLGSISSRLISRARQMAVWVIP